MSGLRGCGTRRARLHRRLLVLPVIPLFGALAVLVVTLLGLQLVEDRTGRIGNATLPAYEALLTAATAGGGSQGAFLQALRTTDAGARATALSLSQSDAQNQDAAWATYRRHAGSSRGERVLRDMFEVANRNARELGAAVLGTDAAAPSFAARLQAEENASRAAIDALITLRRRYYDPALGSSLSDVARTARSARLRLSFGAAGVVLLMGAILVVLAREVRRDERAEGERERQHSIEAFRAELETQLQRGLEMERSEDALYPLIEQALDMTSDTGAMELLVAESTRGHFRRVLSTNDDEAAPAACGVATPSECPVAVTGQTRVYGDSRRLDTCPYLRGRASPVWATCVPVSIAGRTTGVLRAEGPLQAPPPGTLTENLELVARKAGDRLGILRVLARTEMQAQVDSLTGLPNRRTLQNQAIEVMSEDRAVVVAFADLDHFKQLNDTYGHQAGDRALRLFGRVLRDSIRPVDMAGRYGGEEFVIVLPDCNPTEALTVVDRIRTNLAAAIAGTNVPPLTVSIGLAAAQPGDTFSDVVMSADAALFDAKAGGRDRVVLHENQTGSRAATPTPNSHAVYVPERTNGTSSSES